MTDFSHLSDTTPVVVGVGLISQRDEDPLTAKESLQLMLEAVLEAGRDSGVPDVLRHVGKISIPKGRWRYADPGRHIARAIGAPNAVSELSKVGVLQQTLIADACRAVKDGEHRAVVVAGGEAGYRIQRAKKAGVELSESEAAGTPDSVLTPPSPLRSPAELAVGFEMPVGLYAMLDCAFRVSRGETPAQRLASIGSLYAGFSEIAANNPHAWSRDVLTADEINTPSPANRVQAFPYNRLHCSNWSVDQATALLVVSVGLARELEIDPSRFVFAAGSSESNHMETVSSRYALHRSPGARAAGEALVDHAGIAIRDIDLLELYSCFPVAIDIVAAELGLERDRSFTITGGMSYAGGPYNNYQLHSTAQMIRHLRARTGTTGLVGCISGVVTKQAFGLWSTRPPARAYESLDVTAEVANASQPKAEAVGYDGTARVVSWTILHSPKGPPRAIVIADTEDDRRCVAVNDSPQLVAALDERDVAGAAIKVVDGVFSVT